MTQAAKLAVVQLSSHADVKSNLARIEEYVTDAAAKGALFVSLPENCCYMGKKEQDKLAIAESFNQGPIQAALGNIARANNIWIHAGTVPIEAIENKVFGASIIWDNFGQIVARYNKMHLFDVNLGSKESYLESDTLMPGATDEIVCVDSPIGRLGLSVCYDLRFPELYRKLVNKGAEVLLVPSAFTETTGQAHWEVLLRARAIENQCYVVAADQVGMHPNGRKTYGHSMVVSPWGNVLVNSKSQQGVLMAEIDLDLLNETRQKMPILQHMRL